nr:hypothetical protein GCM10020093_030140 [Planobispora longispora]
MEAAQEPLAIAVAMRPDQRDYVSALKSVRATLQARKDDPEGLWNEWKPPRSDAACDDLSRPPGTPPPIMSSSGTPSPAAPGEVPLTAAPPTAGRRPRTPDPVRGAGPSPVSGLSRAPVRPLIGS